VDKCTGCGDCATQLIDDAHPATEIDGRLWADRIEIDQAKCIQCGDCADACMAENPLKQAMTTVVRERFKAVEKKADILAPTSLQAVLAMGVEERKAFWRNHFQKCIKCYGCVDVCPVQVPGTHDTLSLEKWVPKGHVPPSFPLFHLIRAYQIWDTCVLCGDCEQTCPAEIPLKMLQDMVRYFSPEEVFDLVPDLEKEAQNAIVDFVNRHTQNPGG
jgi:ferredoxin